MQCTVLVAYCATIAAALRVPLRTPMRMQRTIMSAENGGGKHGRDVAMLPARRRAQNAAVSVGNNMNKRSSVAAVPAAAKLDGNALLNDDSDDDLDNFQFRERTCCKCSYFAHGLLCKYHSTCCCAMCCYMFMSIFGASWFVWFNTCTLTLLFHMFAAVTNCVGRCYLQEPKVED